MKNKTVEEKKVKKPKKEVAQLEDATLISDTVDTLSEYDHKKVDHDIKYNPPLSYRHFRLIGWISMAIMFISMMLLATLRIRSSLGTISISAAESLQKAADILSYFSALPLPLFLIANFAVILQSKNDYKKLIMRYLKLVLAIYVGFLIVYYHYIVVLIMSLGEMSFSEARQLSIDLFTLLGKQNGLVVNVFIDLFCCVLIMYFLDYNPKKYFQGKNIVWFRLLVILPILYEVGSAVMMGCLGMNSLIDGFNFSLPPEILPLVGKKPIGMIVGFVFICIFVKHSKNHYMKKGGTEEGYAKYVDTNRHVFNFSKMMAIVFGAIAILDIVVTIIPIAVMFDARPNPEYLEQLINVFTSFTLGKSICLILVVPFTLLFSYRKKHNNQKFDKLLPLIGIGLVVFSIIETLFFGIVL